MGFSWMADSKKLPLGLGRQAKAQRPVLECSRSTGLLGLCRDASSTLAPWMRTRWPAGAPSPQLPGAGRQEISVSGCVSVICWDGLS